MTSITIKNEYGEYTIEVNQDDMSISDIIENLVEPCLKATGYSTDVINEYFEN